MTDGVVELALVGAGRMGRMHLRALDPAGGRTSAVRVTDVVEPIKAARDALRCRGYRVHATLAEAIVLCRRTPDELEIHCHGGDAAVQRPPSASSRIFGANAS